jgi:hypothetical protein
MNRSLSTIVFVLMVCACAPSAAVSPTAASSVTPPSPEKSPSLTAPESTQTPLPTSLPSKESPTSLPTSTFEEGWLVYENNVNAYDFSFPPSAKLDSHGVNGFLSEELPANMTSEDYFAQLRTTYPGDLCVGLQYEMSFVAILVPLDKGGRYASPCGVSGIGAYDIVRAAEIVIIGGTPHTAKGYQIFERDAAKTFRSEFFSTELEDGTRISYGGDWTDAGATYEEYLPVKAIVLKILASYHSQ